jgi:hypothetical protein
MTVRLDLTRPEEPLELRSRLRQMAFESAQDGPSVHQRNIGEWLWECWRASLEPARMDRETFFDVVDGYRRELWFWLVGDRGWDQMLSGLAGRVSRRLPSS